MFSTIRFDLEKIASGFSHDCNFKLAENYQYRLFSIRNNNEDSTCCIAYCCSMSRWSCV